MKKGKRKKDIKKRLAVGKKEEKSGYQIMFVPLWHMPMRMLLPTYSRRIELEI